jgi:hypothetical protein
LLERRGIRLSTALGEWIFEATYQDCGAGGISLLEVHPIGFAQSYGPRPRFAEPAERVKLQAPTPSTQEEGESIWEKYVSELPKTDWIIGKPIPTDEDITVPLVPRRAAIIYPARIDILEKTRMGQPPLESDVYLWMAQNGYIPKDFEIEWLANNPANREYLLEEYDLILTFGYDGVTGKYTIIRVVERTVPTPIERSNPLQGILERR